MRENISQILIILPNVYFSLDKIKIISILMIIILTLLQVQRTLAPLIFVVEMSLRCHLTQTKNSSHFWCKLCGFHEKLVGRKIVILKRMPVFLLHPASLFTVHCQHVINDYHVPDSWLCHLITN